MDPRFSTKNLSQGFVIGIVLTTFGIAILIASFQIDKDPGGGWGARIFPMFGSIALLMVGILELRFGLRDTQARPDYIPSNILVLFGLAIGYIFLIGKIGYLLSTGLVAPMVFLVFGVRNLIGLFASAVLCPVAYHLIFFELLGVFPPYGKWFDLLSVIQGN